MTTTCTVRIHADGTTCGKPAVYTEHAKFADEVFGECAEHAADFGSMASTANMRVKTGYEVGDEVDINRGGIIYTGTIVKVGARGAAYAEFTYKNGSKRTVRV